MIPIPRNGRQGVRSPAWGVEESLGSRGVGCSGLGGRSGRGGGKPVAEQLEMNDGDLSLNQILPIYFSPNQILPIYKFESGFQVRKAALYQDKYSQSPATPQEKKVTRVREQKIHRVLHDDRKEKSAREASHGRAQNLEPRKHHCPALVRVVCGVWCRRSTELPKRDAVDVKQKQKQRSGT